MRLRYDKPNSSLLNIDGRLCNNHTLIIAFLTLIIYFCSAIPALPAKSDPKSKLTEIQQELKKKKLQVEDVKHKEQSILSQIEDINQTIHTKRVELTSYKRKVSSIQSDIDAMKDAIISLEKSLESRKVKLRKRLVALYKQKYDNKAIILTSVDDFNDLIRKTTYLKYISNYDSRLIQSYVTGIEKVGEKKNELVALRENLNQTIRVVRQTTEEMKTNLKRRDRLLATVRSKRSSYEKSIKELEISSVRLKKMISRLAKEKLPKSLTGKGFSSLRRHLPWPVNGKVLVPFGKYKDPKYNIVSFKNGIEIKSHAGAEPLAVANGRVVYADFFKGYGLLLIIDHGSGYHSLYANLSSIFPETGDILKRDAPLGKVGGSRIMKVPTLYFEIRYKGKPVDPLKWLKKRSR